MQDFQRYLLPRKSIGVIIIVIGVAIGVFTYIQISLQQNEATHSITSRNQNPYIEEYSLPVGSWPNGIIADKQGTIWAAASKTNKLFSLEPKSGMIKEYPINDEDFTSDNLERNSTMVWAIVQDNDGVIWFSPLGTKSIWTFDSTTGKFHMIKSETGSPFQMKVDKNGDIWFTTLSKDTLGVIQSMGNDRYKVSSFYLGNDTGPAGIFLQDDSVWIAEVITQKIVQYKISQQKELVRNITKTLEIPASVKTILSAPTDLIVSDNTVWLTEHDTSFLTEYKLSSGDVVRYPTSQNFYHATTLPFWIRNTSDGKGLWFNEHEGNKLAYFDIYNRTLLEYNIPSLPKDGFLTYPLNIALDTFDDKKLWFSEWNTDKIGLVNGKTAIHFGISADTDKIMLRNDTSKGNIVNLEVSGQSPYSSNEVFLNASSSIMPTAGFGNMTVKFSSSVLDLSSSHRAQLFLQNHGVPAGNYTLGISASDGFVTKTIFLDLVIP